MSVLECPFCKNPNLFHADFSDSPQRDEVMAARGQFWKRIQNNRYPAWPIPAIRRETNDLNSKLLVGKDHFAPKWQPLTVEVLGYSFTDKPQMPPVPLLGMTTIRGIATAYYILWNACRITHEEFSFVVNLHWWPSHGRVFTVERFDFDSTAARSALNTALSLFAPGRGKPSQYFINNKAFFEALKLAVMQRYDAGVPPLGILEIEIAEELFPEANDGARTMRRWLQTSWRRWNGKTLLNQLLKALQEIEKKGGHN